MTNSTTYNNYIAGEWVAGTETIENRNPSEPSDLIGLYAQADEKQLHAALAAAKAAQEKWADVGLEKRQSVLAAIGKEMIERSAELGEQLSREEGKAACRRDWRSVSRRSVFQLFCRRNFAAVG